MGTRNNPSEFDCYANAEPDEPMFVLLARDRGAPFLVRQWARSRERSIAAGSRPPSELAQVAEARELADQMDEWRRKNWPNGGKS